LAPAGIELATFGLGNRCSILLSYGARQQLQTSNFKLQK
jgi:hypothetical protein